MSRFTKGEVKNETDDIVVSRKALADILNVSVQRVTDLVNDGRMRQIGRGHYPLRECVRAYIQVIKADADRKAMRSETSSLERLREQKLQSEMIKVAEKDRSLITVDEARSVMQELIGEMLASLNGLPARITKNPAERHRIDGIFDEARQRLSDRLAQKAASVGRGSGDPEAEAED